MNSEFLKGPILIIYKSVSSYAEKLQKEKKQQNFLSLESSEVEKRVNIKYLPTILSRDKKDCLILGALRKGNMRSDS